MGLVQPESKELGVFRLGLLEVRDFGIGVFREREKVLVGDFCLGFIARQRGRSGELQVRERAYGILARMGVSALYRNTEFRKTGRVCGLFRPPAHQPNATASP